MSFFSSESAFGLVATIVCLAVYILTLCPTVYVGDAGELSAAAYTLGIVHPPGYPLYTLLGWCFAHLVPGRVAVRMNLMSALLAAVSVYFSFLILRRLLVMLGDDAGGKIGKYAAAIGAIIWGTSNTLWASAIAAEVYSLGMALATLFVYFCLVYAKDGGFKNLIFAFYVLGLAFANHLSAAFALLPIAIIISLARRPGFVALVWSAIVFVAALTIYLYISLRAGCHPLIDFGQSGILTDFWAHITGAKYRGFFAEPSLANLLVNSKRFLRILPDEFALALVGVMGIIILIPRLRTVGIAFLTAMLVNICFGVMYEIVDIQPHFLVTIFLAVIGLVILVPVVAISLAKRLGWVWRWGWVVFLVVVMILTVGRNISRNDASHSLLAEDLGRMVLGKLPPNALLVSVGWTAGAPCVYLHCVERFRSDVIFVEPLTMTSYLADLVGYQGGRQRLSEAAMALRLMEKWPGDAYLGKDHVWGSGNPFKYHQLPLQGAGMVYKYGQRRVADLSSWQGVEKIVEEAMKKKIGIMEALALLDIYLAWGEDLASAGKTQEALAKFEVARELVRLANEPMLDNSLGIFFRHLGLIDYAMEHFQRVLQSRYLTNSIRADALVNMGNIYRQRGQLEMAKQHYQEALRFKKGSTEAAFNLGITEAHICVDKEDYRGAVRAFERALKIDPLDQALLYNLGLLNDRYLGDATAATRYYSSFLQLSPKNDSLADYVRSRLAQLRPEGPTK